MSTEGNKKGVPLNSPVTELGSDVNRGQQKEGPIELTSVIEFVSDVAAGRGVQGGLSGQQDTRQGD